MDRTRFNYKLPNFNFFLIVNFLINYPKYFYVDFDKSFSLKEKDFFKLKFFINLYKKRNIKYYFLRKNLIFSKKIININLNIINIISF
jgi:hypothetical protein